MFGQTIRIYWDGFGVTLRPLKKVELDDLAEKFSWAGVHQYTLQVSGFTQEQEEAWYQKNLQDPTQYTWGIIPDGLKTPVGVTGIHGIDINLSCTSGIIIFDHNYWGKGIASRAHLGRTWFAAGRFNRATIRSEVMVSNKASVKALLGVGYIVTGKNHRCRCVDGQFVDSYILNWSNPRYSSVLYEENAEVPSQVVEGMKIAKVALQRAKGVIEVFDTRG